MQAKYVLVTPAYNEEAYLDGLIESVVAQSHLPFKWIIVDDGSTDATSEIIKKNEDKFDFIECLSLSREDIESYYSRRVHVVLAGIESLEELEFDFLGVLDADITPGPEYFEGVLSEFERDPKLGIAAGIFKYEENGELINALMDKNCTPGSNQVFRRQCYDQIGGYVPLKFGGDDSLCDIMARFHGWKTQSFEDYPVIQHRVVGTGDDMSILGARFRQGLTDYGIATHPFFMLVKCMRRSILEKPFIIGGMARLAGFIYGCFLREGRKISPEAQKFIRKEQLGRIFGKKINV